MTRHGV
ncbi:2-succinyl-5-enolpyruvyl-6-hydroxy-3-cyclohexene-1-carboxylic-acid synthase, partial [Yersinia pestis PY-103]